MRITRDGHIVLLHDQDLGRVAGLKNNSSEMTRSELSKIELIDGSSLLFLDEFVETYAAYNWVLDIKPEFGFEVLASLNAWLSSKKLHDWFLNHAKFLVWKKPQEKVLIDLFGDVPRYANQVECWRAGLSIVGGSPSLGGFQKGRTYSLPPTLGPLDLFQKKYVDLIHGMGSRASAYLPNTPSQAAAAVTAGFDEILTNYLPV